MEIYSISRVPSKFNTLQKTVVTLVVNKGVAWGILPLAITNIQANQTVYTPLYALSVGKTTKNPGNTTNRDTYVADYYYPAMDVLFSKYLINNDAISAADKLALGIHAPIISHTPIPDPTASPMIKIVGKGEDLQLMVELRNAVTKKLGKPKGVGFCEIWYSVDAPVPVTIDDTTSKINIPKSGTIMTFLGTQQGKRLYYFARWVTKRGGFGPWTGLLSVTIP